MDVRDIILVLLLQRKKLVFLLLSPLHGVGTTEGLGDVIKWSLNQPNLVNDYCQQTKRQKLTQELGIS